MRADEGEPYYSAYEKRYKAVYEQGIPYWTAFPDELAAVHGSVDRFLTSYDIPADGHVTEFGCGEGFVGDLIAGRGLRYTGIDLSRSALAKAGERLHRFGTRAALVHGDLTKLSMLSDSSFDAGMDVRCLHMLVVDADRKKYLAEARRVLTDDAATLFVEGLNDHASDHAIEDFEDWLAHSKIDIDTPEDRPAWVEGREATIRLPRIPARSKSVVQYQREMSEAGFLWLEHEILGDERSIAFTVR